jgi:hypothetical protein
MIELTKTTMQGTVKVEDQPTSPKSDLLKWMTANKRIINNKGKKKDLK